MSVHTEYPEVNINSSKSSENEIKVNEPSLDVEESLKKINKFIQDITGSIDVSLNRLLNIMDIDKLDYSDS
jgi:hypothetical protein